MDDFVFTSGPDHRVCVWKAVEEKEGYSLSYVSSYFSEVADISCLDVYKLTKKYFYLLFFNVS